MRYIIAFAILAVVGLAGGNFLFTENWPLGAALVLGDFALLAAFWMGIRNKNTAR